MSKLRRDIARRKLRGLFEKADHESFLQMVWAVDALQSGREGAAAKFLSYPREAAATDSDSQFRIHKWVLESLVNGLFATPNAVGRRTLNCGNFSTAAALADMVRKLEDAEDGIVLKHKDILNEIPRLIQRQFEWQRGFMSRSQIYRSLFLYGGERSTKYFLESRSVGLNDFFNCGFALYAMALSSPAIMRALDLSAIGITEAQRDASLAILAISRQRAPREAAGLQNEQGHPAYQRSLLRLYPFVSFGENQERLRAPLPALIAWRITAGLYYDLVGGGSHIWREIGERFESYSLELLKRMLPAFDVGPSFEYLLSGRPVASPDILIQREGALIIAIECKAKKMTFAAKFGDDPLAEAKQGFQEIVKGVFQVWRFFSHCRQSIVDRTISDEAIGVLLTLDNWMEMSSNQRTEVLRLAHEMADDARIDAQDRKPISFCSTDDMEATLRAADQPEFIRAIQQSIGERFQGWHLASIHRDLTNGANRENSFPFDHRIAELNPSWRIR